VPDCKPLFIYDGNCGFCKIWIEYWKRLTGDRVDYAPSQQVASQYPQIPPREFARAAHLVRPDGTVVSGAAAVFETLAMEKAYKRSRIFAFFAEAVYSFIARRRELAYHVTRFTFGTRIEPAQFQTTQWIFLRALALIYLAAFGSLAGQITGLIGERGILPLHDFMGAVEKNVGSQKFFVMPTVFWWDSSDHMLTSVCFAGMAFAILLLFGRLEKLSLIALFILYLSLSVSGQDFLQFQWDGLLLEAGFLAIFLGRAPIIIWLFRWLVFRLNFMSGTAKLLSHDATWRNFTALDFHYHTQPLPTVLAWYADKMPAWFQHSSTFMVLAIEIAVPFLIFAPRLLRISAAWCIIGLQVLIMLTGNYAFFNFLTIALCLFLFDDRAFGNFSPPRFFSRRSSPERSLNSLERGIIGVFAAFIFLLGFTHVLESFGDAPDALRALTRIASPLEIVNSYGLFAVMTTTRPEIVVEGSNDSEQWSAYEFRYKPGQLDRAPKWVAPLQPRVDWQMWFAALGNFRQNLWFVGFVVRLLQGSPEVLRLLEKNPFPDHPPHYIRAIIYEYSFTTWQERRQTGAWWKRVQVGTYLPPVGMKASASLLPGTIAAANGF
jgi:lipase maturation factor 1